MNRLAVLACVFFSLAAPARAALRCDGQVELLSASGAREMGWATFYFDEQGVTYHGFHGAVRFTPADVLVEDPDAEGPEPCTYVAKGKSGVGMSLQVNFRAGRQRLDFTYRNSASGFSKGSLGCEDTAPAALKTAE